MKRKGGFSSAPACGLLMGDLPKKQKWGEKKQPKPTNNPLNRIVKMLPRAFPGDEVTEILA